VADTELVAGASAGWLDVWRRVLNLASIVVPLVVGFALNAVGVPITAIGVVAVVLFVAGFIVTLVVGSRVTRTMRLEMQAGYSTLYDVPEFELRDARTRELLRGEHEVPDNPGKRSLVAGLFRVKPGTVLAKRLDDDESSR